MNKNTVSAFAVILFLVFTMPASPQSGFGVEERRAMTLYQTGRNLERQGNAREAETCYNEAIGICTGEISQNTADQETYTVLTWALQRKGNYGEVITWGERGLRVFPEEYRILETMGEAYFYLDDYGNSLRLMQRYVSVLPRSERTPTAYFFVGEIYRLQGKYLLSDMAYTTAVRLEPGVPLWWYRLGLTRENAGEAPSAADAYEEALSLNPGYQPASEGLARVRRP